VRGRAVERQLASMALFGMAFWWRPNYCHNFSNLAGLVAV
jgi:hypothetical protein